MTVRSLLGGLGALVVLMIGVNVAGEFRDGTLPASFRWETCSAAVTAVPGSGGALLRPGDRIDVRSLPAEERLIFADPSGHGEGRAGGVATLPVVRDGRPMTVRVPFERRSPAAAQRLLDAVGLVVYVLTGALVLWRGRDAAAYALGAFLLCFAAGGFAFDRTGFLPLPARVAFNLLAFALTAGAVYSGFALNVRLSEGVVPAGTLRVVRAAGAAYCFVYAVIVVGSQLALPLFGCTLPLYGSYVLLFFAGAVGVMAILGAAVVKSRFAEPRLAWLFWTTVACFVPYIVVRSIDAVLGLSLMSQNGLRVAAEALPFLLLPLGYAYGILRYRVVDVSFVVNRALVYAVLSTALLGGVILVEAFAEKAALGKNASLALELAVPLVIGLSFNALHKRLERIIDRVLFGAKHRAEEALRRFVADCGFIEKAPVLRARTVSVVCENSRATGAALYDRMETGYRLALAVGAHAFAGDVDADDPAFVRMRATSAPVDLADLSSAVGRTGVALPLAVGGRVTGALVCGARASGEPYAPDERELLRQVAQSVAAALVAAEARERARFVAEVADGKIGFDEARVRARELRTDD